MEVSELVGNPNGWNRPKADIIEDKENGHPVQFELA